MNKEHASADTKLLVLADHHKDTQRIIEQLNRSRDINFFYILALLGVMAFQFFSPQTSGNFLGQIIKQRLGVETTLSTNYISSLIWLGLFVVALRYEQAVIYLEKQYKYIHHVEGEISAEYGGRVFIREGQAYLKDYPPFSKWIHTVYRIIFPVLFIVAISVKIWNEWNLVDKVIPPLLLNSTICVLLLITTGLYIRSLGKLKKVD